MGKLIKIDGEYANCIKDLSLRFKQSQIKAAIRVNSEMLRFYFNLGADIVNKKAESRWGDGFFANLSRDLQNELPGLTGFSETNIKNMRIFYETWESVIGNHFSNNGFDVISLEDLPNRQFTSADLSEEDWNCFLSVSFSNHREIIRKTTILEERLYYIRRCATEFWKVETTKYYLKEDLYHKEGSIQQTNFARTARTFQKGFAKHRGFEKVVVNLQKRILPKFMMIWKNIYRISMKLKIILL